MSSFAKKIPPKAFWIAALVLVVIPMGLLVLISLPAAIPTDLEEVSAAVPPINDRAARKPASGDRCALDEARRDGSCVRVSAEVDRREVTFASSIPDKGFDKLQGTLVFPKGLTGRPAVILIGGSGPTDRHSTSPGDLLAQFKEPFPLFDALAQLLAERGLVVLQYDKRACAGCYKKFPEDLAFSDFVTDARDGINFLAEQPEVDGDNILVMGHSQGGQLAPFVVDGDRRIAGLVLLAGSTQTFEPLVVEQLGRYAEIRRGHLDYLGAWLLDAQADPVASCYARAREPGADLEATCLIASVPMREFLAYDDLVRTAPEVLGRLSCPTMAIQGTLDINIHPDQIPWYQKQLAGKDAEVHRLPGVSHPLTNGLAPTDPPQLDARVQTLLTDFVHSITQRKREGGTP